MSKKKPNILYVTSFLPHGPTSGAQLRVLNIGRQLQRVGNVSLVLSVSEEIDKEHIDRTRSEFNILHIAKVLPTPLKGLGSRIRYELDPTYQNTRFSSASDDDIDLMIRMVHEHDVVWVHSIRTANEFRIYRWPHAVLDIDDLQSRLYDSFAREESRLPRKLLDHRLSVIWRRRERLLKERFDVLAVCSESDRRYLGSDTQVFVVPNGFTFLAEVPERRPIAPVRIGFIGSFGFKPNQVGVAWFINEVWPMVKKVAPEATLRLVGMGSDTDFPRMGQDIHGLGFVEDPADEIATWSAMIVPIWIGGGTRVKVAEAFARKCPVVATPLGAFGYQVLNGEDLLLADDAKTFAAACLRLIKDPELGTRIAENAWKKFLETWTWDAIGGTVSKAVDRCLDKDNRNDNVLSSNGS
jgi:glycosyltransferase involved in cell wall biosynthesis